MICIVKSTLIILLLTFMNNSVLYVRAVDTIETNLPEPRFESEMSIEETLYQRASIRQYTDEALTLEEISQLLWAAQGENQKGTRTAPSAGALYPIEVYFLVGKVEPLSPGLYHYSQDSHALTLLVEDDLRPALTERSLSQESIHQAPAVIVLSGVVERTAEKYGDRAERYMWIEVGHVTQNILLQAQALNIGGVSIGAFDDGGVHDLLMMEENEQPLYVIPLGKID